MGILDLFPVPRTLRLSEGGISISERAVRYVSFDRRGRKLRVKRIGEVSIEESVVSAGVLKDKTALTEALKKVRSEGFRFVSVALPEEKSYLYVTEVEKVPYRDLRDAVAFTVEENVPVPLDKSAFSFSLADKGEKIRAAVTVLPRELGEGYAEAFEAAGMIPASFDIESEAIGRALVPEGDKRAHLIVYIGERKAGFYIEEEGMVEFSSTLALAPSSTSERAQMLEAEIRKLFVFWGSRPGQKKVERIIVAGPGASDDALVSSMMAAIETPYALGNVWQNVYSFDDRLPDMPFDASLPYAAAIGAALPPSDNIYV